MNDIKLQVRLPQLLHIRLKTHQENRTIPISLNRFVLTLLEEALEEREKEDPDPLESGKQKSGASYDDR